jgi:hypothetical protein
MRAELVLLRSMRSDVLNRLVAALPRTRMTRRLVRTAGTAIIRVAKRIQSARSSRIHGDFTICMETFLSGVMNGLESTRPETRRTHAARRMGRVASFGAVTGMRISELGGLHTVFGATQGQKPLHLAFASRLACHNVSENLLPRQRDSDQSEPRSGRLRATRGTTTRSAQHISPLK